MNKELKAVIRRGLDQRVNLLNDARRVAEKPVRGWLRAVREAVGLTQLEVGQKLSVTKQSYAELETAEERGRITLDSLQRAAGALDCELVYFLVPRPAVAETFTELARHHDPAMRHLEASEHSMALEGQAVGDLKPAKKAP